MEVVGGIAKHQKSGTRGGIICAQLLCMLDKQEAVNNDKKSSIWCLHSLLACRRCKLMGGALHWKLYMGKWEMQEVNAHKFLKKSFHYITHGWIEDDKWLHMTSQGFTSPITQLLSDVLYLFVHFFPLFFFFFIYCLAIHGLETHSVTYLCMFYKLYHMPNQSATSSAFISF